LNVGAGLMVRVNGRDNDTPPPAAVKVSVKAPAGAEVAVIRVTLDVAVPGVTLAGEIETVTPCGAPVIPSFNDALKPPTTDPQLTCVAADAPAFNVRLTGEAASVQPAELDTVRGNENDCVTDPPVAEISTG